jgi:hypothetical protein
MFCVHIFWKVQDFPDACWTCSAVLSLYFGFSKTEEKKPKKNKKQKRRVGEKLFLAGEAEAASDPRDFLAIMC